VKLLIERGQLTGAAAQLEAEAEPKGDPDGCSLGWAMQGKSLARWGLEVGSELSNLGALLGEIFRSCQ
jgi:hypothetical protein